VMQDPSRYRTARPTDSVFRAYLESLARFVEWLLAQGYDVRLLIGDVVDKPVVQEFKALLKSRLARFEDERIIDEPVASVEEIFSQIATTDVIVATRFHTTLFSLLLAKPVIAISFHHKCSSLMSQMGLAEYCQDINGLNADRLIEQFCRLRQNAGDLKESIRERVEACRDALDEQYGIIFKDICPERQQVAAPTTGVKAHPNPKLQP